jgi:hypothetical protein
LHSKRLVVESIGYAIIFFNIPTRRLGRLGIAFKVVFYQGELVEPSMIKVFKGFFVCLHITDWHGSDHISRLLKQIVMNGNLVHFHLELIISNKY